MNELARDLTLLLDPTELMKRAGMEPDPWQSDFLRSEAQRILLLCARQTGKSTATAALALHTALSEPHSLTLLLSPSLRQSSELFKRVMAFYRVLGDTMPSEAESALRLELANGSRIVSLPGTEQTIRGFSGVRLLVVDEASRVEDDLYFSVRPMLAVSGGRLVALSTPFGKRGWFFEAWGEGDWRKMKVTASECPRISREFLEQERRTLGERWFKQEYECSFEENMDAVFTHEVIQRAVTHDVKPLFARAL
jgi:hypothetical protein